MTTKKITKDNFWDTDLKDVEASFLPEGKTILDLPVYFNDVVPCSNVLLSQSQNKQKQ